MSAELNCEDDEPTFKAPFMVAKVASKKPTFKVPTDKSDVPQVQDSQCRPGLRNTVSKIFPAQKCPYDEPSWAGVPETYYKVSILRHGVIIAKKKLNKSHLVIGRHQDCDIIMEHPSISRFHAVLQYRRPPADASDSEKKLKGFYLYDLGSTHGSQLNKEQLEAKTYHRVRVGHQIKFGFSTRVFILEGPPDDEEPESELSVTEIIQRRNQRMLENEKAAEDSKKDDEDTGINWGMAEDAEEEDEEMISDVNPFSLNNVPNEELYLDDPKKTLRGWFEREGYELEYKVEDKGVGQFLCRVEIPIDTGSGSSVMAETVVKGKKKEAVVQCALEACRILDRYGELRKAHHDAKKRKTKNWKEDDYYDSDEDEFLDRTGDLAQKRAQRKARLEKTQVVETYASLKEKIENIDARVSEIQKELEASKAAEALNKDVEGDCLDSFMKQLKSGTALDKVKRSQLRSEQTKLLLERQHFVKLANIAKPVDLPPLAMAPLLGKTSTSSLGAAMPMVGSMKGRKRPVLPLVGMTAKIARMAEVKATDKSEDDQDKKD